jgi:1,4-alpha-glucan branching enzyme
MEMTSTKPTKPSNNPSYPKPSSSLKGKTTTKRSGGMGAIYTPEATTFRVWAPNAERVFVMGAFNEWKENEHQLEHEGDGYWAIAVSQVPAGAAYKYVLHTPEGKLERRDPYARALTGQSGEAYVVDTNFEWEDQKYEAPKWSEMNIYQLHVGTFFAKDGQHGTFQTVVEKLDYLRDLGVNAIKILPPAEFPGNESWGYNPSFPFAVENSYGGPQGLKTLINEAHKRGIAVLIDVVYNHFGPLDMDLWRFDGWSENEGGGIYFYNDWRAETPWGHTRPDYGRPEVRQFLLDNAHMWLEEFHADGLRVDSVSHIRSVDGSAEEGKQLPDAWGFLQELNDSVAERYPWKIMIAEDLTSNPWITKPTSEGGAGFNSQWDSAFLNGMRQQLIEEQDESRNMAAAAGALAFSYGPDAFYRVVYTESHDDVAEGSERMTMEVMPDDPYNYVALKRATLGLGLVFTAPGIPMVFQGQEFCYHYGFDAKLLNAIDWEVGKKLGGLVQLSTDLMHMRRNAWGESEGLLGHRIEMLLEDEEKKVMVYQRWQENVGRPVVVVANFCNCNHTGIRIPLPHMGSYKALFNSDAPQYHEGFKGTGPIGLEAEAVAWAEKKQSALIDIAPYSLIVFGMNG